MYSISTKDHPGVRALISSTQKHPRVYPFPQLRAKIVGLIASCILCEKSEFTSTIEFAVRNGNQDVLRATGGMLDTGLLESFLSCGFVNDELAPLGVHVKMFSNGAKTIFRTIDNMEIKSIGEVTMRFRIHGETKFINASFHVSENPIVDCDVLIGSDIIGENYRLVRIGGPGFIEPPPKPVPEQELARASRAKQATSAADRALKKDIKAQQPPNRASQLQSHPTK
ncbi:hypothetical protein AOQ84DRAFT_222190 [Glonium stellatum]|uniref:Uncharacterized protein n=1 Tax=Glonium stellatum TaxID=574774 RepID=A0A8E2F060_9PEZI|nr:hypothetical protein AOQ84DRAFT_222190 [Glonium stellatum]